MWVLAVLVMAINFFLVALFVVSKLMVLSVFFLHKRHVEIPKLSHLMHLKIVI